MEEQNIRELARQYYSRKDVQKVLLISAKNREVVPRYFESFGKRPDTLHYENDVLSLAEKGATSFHYSEELWSNPLELSTGMTQKQLNDMRIGWDLIIDIDSKYLDYSKIAAQLLAEALKFHNLKNFGVKFSGNKGFHIGIAFNAFPDEAQGIKIKDFFPEGARIIASYLKDFISKKLVKKIAELTPDTSFEGLNITDEEGAKKVTPDIVLVSSRHLLRMPYSLHEKSGLVSIVIKPEQIKDFQPRWATPNRVIPRPFLPVPEKNEAKELLMQALDWNAHANKKSFEQNQSAKKDFKNKEAILKGISPDMYPPCVQTILKGMKDDGRKRALFVLINFFRSLSISKEEIQKKIDEWNKLNYTPLREGYIKAQLSWFEKQKTMLPPNCDKIYYQDLGICSSDFLCKKIKNPVNYAIRKAKQEEFKKNLGKKPNKSERILNKA